MHKSIKPADRDFYEQLGWLVLFLVSDQDMWFRFSDPNLVYWSKCHFLSETGPHEHHYLDLIHDYMSLCTNCQINDRTKKRLMELLFEATDEYKNEVPQEPRIHHAIH